ncbi:MAG: D-alanyl-D-alanine carboxypeptidase family protein [bacterium]|nr:D-alanyl-D-alanine carboxypeptidase family protein [bacterium]
MIKLKKIIILLLILIIPVTVKAEELDLTAKSSILIEASTGEILSEKNSDEKLAPASMTKIMTMLLIMESLEKNDYTLEDKVNISTNAASMGGSQVFLEAGSELKVKELLKAIAIASANDAAVAMAEYTAGSTESFVNLMNEKAASLGCTNTTFKNVHGLDTEGHLTTAKDMAIMARELLKHEEILNYSSIYEEFLNKPDGSSTWMVNTNKLIKYYNGLDGLKTGFTKNAGYCLTATAKRNNMRLISVVMSEPTTEKRSSDTIKLLNYGFANYKIKVVMPKDQDLGSVEIKNGKKETVEIKLTEDATNLESISDNKKYGFNINVDKIKAPIKVGDIIGKLEITIDGSVKKEIPITVKEDVKKANIWDLYKRNLNKILIGA